MGLTRRQAGEMGVISLLDLIGEDPTREGLQGTPDRVVRSLLEMTEGYKQDPAKILSKTFKEPYDEMIIVKHIDFWSLCEHHLLPFYGVVHFAYIPNQKVIGLSKIPRLVQCFAKRLQIQERMTQDIANAVQEHLKPKGVGVVVEATHLCMQARGIKNKGAMTTNCLLGVFKDKPEVRQEFLASVRMVQSNA